MKFERLAVIGCGLMGGSFALALKQAGLVTHVAGFSASESTRQKALDLGVIDAACGSAAQAVDGADLVLLAVPVGATEEALRSIAPHLANNALLMDVGSTKSDVVAAARAALGERLPCFVPAHPIAGKEKAGVEHAEAALYQACITILTPLPENTLSQISKAQQIWEAVGSHVHTMSAQQHDTTFAAVSHLPHLLAFAYMQGLAAQHDGAQHVSFAGPGFRDFSRIAASDPAIWRDILLSNRAEVLTQVAHFKQALSAFESALHDKDTAALNRMVTLASDLRSRWHPRSKRAAP
jgi:prephenate dehydrogenase